MAESHVRSFAILTPGSPNAAFFSQVAALSLALHRLEWKQWQPTLHLYLGGQADERALETWRPHLRDVEISWASPARSERLGLWWAQDDDAFDRAPRGTDVLVAMDADVMPLASFEDVLDDVARAGEVAGCIAHYPLSDQRSSRAEWEELARGLIRSELDFSYRYSLREHDAGPDSRAPFFVNFGVVFFERWAFERIARPQLRLKRTLRKRMPDPFHCGQVALALAIADTEVARRELPLRYNFPNDPAADRLHPDELQNAVCIHYLRTEAFDRQKIFQTADNYDRFLELPLTGANRVFQDGVRRILGETYPFG